MMRRIDQICDILTLAERYAGAKGIAPATLAHRAMRSSTWLERCATGNVTIRSAIAFVQWLSNHWLPGLEWPAGIDRPDPERGSWQCPLAQGTRCTTVASADPMVPDETAEHEAAKHVPPTSAPLYRLARPGEPVALPHVEGSCDEGCGEGFDPFGWLAGLLARIVGEEQATEAVAADSLSADAGQEVTVPLVATPEGGAEAADYTAPASVTFTAGGALTQTVEVTAVSDEAAEDGESVALSFGELPDGVVAGTTASATVALTDAEAVNTAPTGLPVISGTAQVGEILTATVDGIADADGLDDATFAWQWVSNDGTDDTDIEDADEATYTPVLGDAGKTLKVRVTRSETDETLRLGQRLKLGGSEWSLESAFGAAERSYGAGYGYRLGQSLDLTLDATRREAANDDAPVHEIVLRARMRW